MIRENYLQDIGAPPLINSSLSLIGATNPREIWHEAYLELFPAKVSEFLFCDILINFFQLHQ